MIRIRGPDQTQQIEDASIRELVQRRFTEICDGEVYDAEVHGEMVLVNAGDTLETLERETSCWIATNPFDESRFPDADFVPVCEYLEEHDRCYELTFLASDDGAGVSLFIPKTQAINSDVLAFCAVFAIPLDRTR